MTKPLPHQAEDLIRFDDLKGRLLYAAEMGTGKTVASALWMVKHPEHRPTIVVCPASLKWQWQRELRLHAKIRSEVLEGMRPDGPPASKVVIVNYDILHPRRYGPGWLKILMDMEPKLVILDESQALQDSRSLRSKACKRLCFEVPHVIALSGTPLMSRPADLWPTLNILRPDLFPNFYSFGHKFCGATRKFYGWDFRGASNLGELNRILRKCTIRRTKAEVLPNLPKKQRVVIPLDIDNRREYRAAVNDFLKWLGTHKPSKVDSASKAEQITKLSYLKQLTAKLKLNSVLGWISDFLDGGEGKLIVFGVHRKFLHKIHDTWQRQSVLVTGEVTGRKRQAAVDTFLEDKTCRLFVGNIKAAGTGWSAMGVSAVAFAELAWTPGAHTQAEDRTHGIKRGVEGEHSLAYYLVARDTIETKLLKILQDKQLVIDHTLDGGKVPDTLDVFDLLTAELLKEKRK